MYVIKGFDHLGALLQACKTAFTCLHKQTENMSSLIWTKASLSTWEFQHFFSFRFDLVSPDSTGKFLIFQKVTNFVFLLFGAGQVARGRFIKACLKQQPAATETRLKRTRIKTVELLAVKIKTMSQRCSISTVQMSWKVGDNSLLFCHNKQHFTLHCVIWSVSGLIQKYWLVEL